MTLSSESKIQNILLKKLFHQFKENSRITLHNTLLREQLAHSINTKHTSQINKTCYSIAAYCDTFNYTLYYGMCGLPIHNPNTSS